MTDTIKTIISELAKEPFRKKFTVISFDSLGPEFLLQILNDVLAEIEPSNKMEIRDEAIEDTVVRISNILRVLKYTLPTSMADDPSILRNGLASGDKEVIHPMLEWLLPKVHELKTRAYLANFLVKVEIPQDIRADMEVDDLYSQYEELIEQFKATHKALETIKSKGFTTGEIRKDIEAMESEQETVQRKIERLKRNTESALNRDELLDVIRSFRKEREHSKELGLQQVSQTQALNIVEQKVSRLQRQLKEIKNAGIGATPEGTLQRLEQDKELTKFIAKEKLPKEINVVKKQVEVYTKIVYENIDENDLEDRRHEVEALKSHVNELVKKKLMKTEDDNLILFRQQTTIVTNRKIGLIDRLNELRTEMATFKQEIDSKSEILTKLTGDIKMNEDEFKEYVKLLRVKSTRYRQLKAHLQFLKIDIHVLERTAKILEEERTSCEAQLKAMESRLGVPGFSAAQNTLEKVAEEKSHLDEAKTKSMQEMAETVEALNVKVNSKKNELAPVVKALNAKRQQVQILTHEYEGAKRKFDGAMATTETALNRITKEVEGARKRHDEEQLKYCKLVVAREKCRLELERMKNELKLYASSTSKSGTEHGRKSYKDQLLTKIAEQERLSIKYKDEEREIQKQKLDLVAQAKMWNDIQKMLECKCNLRKRNSINSGSSGSRRSQ